MEKTIVNQDLGKGFAYLEESEVGQLTHSAGVIIDSGDLRFVYCAGKTATNDQSDDPADWDTIVGEGDIKEQTRQVCRNLQGTLAAAGATLDDVVRVRVFVAPPFTKSEFSKVHDARAEFFSADHYPASTLVIVHALAREGALIEIDADAVIPRDRANG